MQKEIEKIFVELIQKTLNLPNNYGMDAQVEDEKSELHSFTTRKSEN